MKSKKGEGHRLGFRSLYLPSAAGDVTEVGSGSTDAGPPNQGWNFGNMVTAVAGKSLLPDFCPPGPSQYLLAVLSRTILAKE